MGSLNAIKYWYEDKTRRVTASTRPSSSTNTTQDPEAEDDCQHKEIFSLDDWKEWLQISTGEEVESDEDNDDNTENAREDFTDRS